MRIQHNIMAMNAYRNFTNNTSALSKNLEKLSSGYKINRAGDDAAGLAISEKMRAQISGLAQAQKNAKSGINLVQTAEGSLTEVHDMLNRMVTLAEQSANGTFDDEVDRANLQKEFEQLRSEIDRIADSSNFNGINLLDGSLSASGASKTGSVAADLSKLGIDITAAAEDITAVKGQYTTNALIPADFSAGDIEDGDTMEMTVNFKDADGVDQSVNIKLTFKDDGTGAITDVYLDDGSENGVKLTAGVTNGAATQAEIAAAFEEALGKTDALKPHFTVADGSNALTFTARGAGSDGASLESFTLKFTDADTAANNVTYATKVDVTRKPTDANKAYDMANAKVWNNDGLSTNAVAEKNLEDAIFEVNGEKFVFVNNDLTDADKEALKEAGVSHWVQLGTANGAAVAADVTAMAEKIQTTTGLKVETGTFNTGAWTSVADGGAPSTKIVFKENTSTSKSGQGGLTLQIGDTSDDFNQLTVSVGDMHAKALGIAGITIGNQAGAQAAVQTIKDAINKVSSTRGDLGALQNRLDHTINNLSVMQENIQDAEATIRDTDVAEEMMAYTKNNILVQSAQAMLAQANQVPQGVLQLLQ